MQEDVEVVLVSYFPEDSQKHDIVGGLSDTYYRIHFIKVHDPEVSDQKRPLLKTFCAR